MNLPIQLFSKAILDAIVERMKNVGLDYDTMINDQAVKMLNQIYEIIERNPHNDTKSVMEIMNLFEEIGYTNF